jgi:hypothetical protein
MGEFHIAVCRANAGQSDAGHPDAGGFRVYYRGAATKQVASGTLALWLAFHTLDQVYLVGTLSPARLLFCDRP